MRLTYDELQDFFMAVFGEVTPQLRGAFNLCKYQSGATQGRDAVDIVRFMKLLYALIKPDGCFHPSRYNPDDFKCKKPAQNNMISVKKAQVTPHPSRIKEVIPSKFKKGKLLGQGGQGTVHMGTYEGLVCAGKTFTGNPDAKMVKSIVDEVNFFMKLDHPHCHYLLGAKVTPGNGGLLELTEVSQHCRILAFSSKRK
jgi:hypothetical protein